MSGHSMNAVMGGDRPISTERVVYKPREIPRGLDWSQHTAPAPVIPIGNGYDGPETTIAEDLAEIRARLVTDPAPQPKIGRPRKPRQPAKPKRAPIDPDQVIADYRNGATVAELCDNHNRSKRTIYTLLRASGDVRDDRYAPNKKAEDPALIAEVVRLYTDEQMSQTAIITKVGTSYQTVRKILLQNNVQIRNDRGGPSGVVDANEAARLYEAGLSIPQIAEQNGWPVTSTRRAIARVGVSMRDDRHTYSGGANRREDTPELVAQVRQMYVDLRMSQGQIADAMDTSRKVVQGIMSRAGIEGRKGESGHMDGAAGLKQRMADLGLTSADLRAWARVQGISVADQGIPPTHVLDAYEEAHQ